MRRALCVALLLGCGCNNFDALVAVCVAEGRCAVSGGDGGASTLQADPTSVSFRAVIGDIDGPATVTVSNAGAGSATNLVVSLEGADVADFKLLTNTCPSTLSPTQSCTVNLQFQPTPGGSTERHATLRIAPANTAPVTVPLTGTTGEDLDVAPALAFGDVAVGGQALSALTVTNVARTPRSVVPGTSAPFSIANNGCMSVGPNQKCDIQVRFEPASQGDVSGSLQLALQGSTKLQNVSLTGRGVTPGVLTLSPPNPFPGEFVDAGARADRPFTVTNTGTQTLGPIALTLTSTMGQGFSFDAGCEMLDAGASCSGVLSFGPAPFGAYLGTFFVDGGMAGGISTALTGYATDVFTMSLAFPLVDAGVGVTTDGGVLPARCENSCSSSLRVLPTAVPTVQLSVTRTPRVDFIGWTGDCQGDAGTCSVLLDRSRQVGLQLDPVALVFVGAATTANLGDIAGAAASCTSQAHAAGLPGQFVALLQMGDGGVIGQLPLGTGWSTVAGDVFAASRQDVVARRWSGVLDRGPGGTVYALGSPLRIWAYSQTGPVFACVSGNSPWSQACCSGGPTLVGVNAGPAGVSEDQSYICNGSANTACFQIDAHGRPMTTRPPGTAMMFVAEADSRLAASGDAGTGYWFDGFCAAAAQRLGESRPYVAFAALSGTPNSRLTNDAGYDGGIYAPNGNRLFPDVTTLMNGTPDNPINFVMYADGGSGIADTLMVSFGATNRTTAAAGNCSNYTSTSGTNYQVQAASRASALAGVGLGCALPYYFYCVPKQF